MKKLLFIALLLVGISASAQISVTNNPSYISAGGTDVTLVTLPPSAPYMATVFVRFPSGNSGTVKLSTISSTAITESKDYAAGESLFITVIGRRFWIDQSVGGDDIEIAY